MNLSNHSRLQPATVGVLLLALAGCTTYIEENPTRTVYVPAPAPAPPVAHRAPPPAPPPPRPAPALAMPAPPQPAAPVVLQASLVIHTENDFVEPLRPHGEWVVVGSYGRCWRPVHVAAGWRPYCQGHWQLTDAGWYWVSEEPWAWATYHYGRWDWTAEFGWVWVPRTQWAPAWVVWRQGAGYIGWAPLPPSATIALDGGVRIHDDRFAPRSFVFVDERRLLEPVHPAKVVVNNPTVINQTVNITKIKVVNKTVINEGPRHDAVERVTGRKLATRTARELRQRDEAAAAPARRPERDVAPKPAPPAPHAVQPKPAVAPAPPRPVIAAPGAKPAEATRRIPTRPQHLNTAARQAAGGNEPKPPETAPSATQPLPVLVAPKAVQPSDRPASAAAPRRIERTPESAAPKAIEPKPASTPAPAVTSRPPEPTRPALMGEDRQRNRDEQRPSPASRLKPAPNAQAPATAAGHQPNAAAAMSPRQEPAGEVRPGWSVNIPSAAERVRNAQKLESPKKKAEAKDQAGREKKPQEKEETARQKIERPAR